MADCFVTGIAPTTDVKALETMLGELPGVQTAKLIVLTKTDRSYEHDSSFLNFIHVGAQEIDSDTIGNIESSSIMTGGGGTGVPGMTTRSSLGYFSHPKVAQHVGNLPIPEDEADNYNDAIEDGRAVVAYQCEGETAAVENAFRSSGVLHVKTFRG